MSISRNFLTFARETVSFREAVQQVSEESRNCGVNDIFPFQTLAVSALLKSPAFFKKVEKRLKSLGIRAFSAHPEWGMTAFVSDLPQQQIVKIYDPLGLGIPPDLPFVWQPLCEYKAGPLKIGVYPKLDNPLQLEARNASQEERKPVYSLIQAAFEAGFLFFDPRPANIRWMQNIPFITDCNCLVPLERIWETQVTPYGSTQYAMLFKRAMDKFYDYVYPHDLNPVFTEKITPLAESYDWKGIQESYERRYGLRKHYIAGVVSEQELENLKLLSPRAFQIVGHLVKELNLFKTHLTFLILSATLDMYEAQPSVEDAKGWLWRRIEEMTLEEIPPNLDREWPEGMRKALKRSVVSIDEGQDKLEDELIQALHAKAWLAEMNTRFSLS